MEAGRAIDTADPAVEQRAGRLELQVGLQFLGRPRVVDERELLGLGLEEEVEWIEYRHLGDQVDLQTEFTRPLGHHDAREVVAERILLPVQEVPGRLDAQRVAENAGPGMRRRTQADNLRTQ